MQDLKPSQPSELNTPLRSDSIAVRLLDSFAQFRARITPKFIHEARATFKAQGFRGVIKRYGWKAFAFFFAYYLIRDSILYIIIPFLIAKGLF